MTTVAQIIFRAGQALGYLGRTDVMSAADANDGLAAFNSMLDSWAGENLASYANQETTFTLVANQQQYTVGPAGQVVAARPDNILQAYITDFNNIRYPVGIIPQDKWNGIGNPNITSQIPTTLFYDPQFPLGVINMFPIPLINYTLTFNSILMQNTFSSLPMTLSMPTGYERAYILNLALEMKSAGFPCLLNADDMAQLRENASQAKRNIKTKNQKEVIADYDSSIVSRGYASYNIYSDSMPRNS